MRTPLPSHDARLQVAVKETVPNPTRAPCCKQFSAKVFTVSGLRARQLTLEMEA